MSGPAVDRKFIRRHKLAAVIGARAGISRQAVSLWTKVPLDHVQLVSDLTGIPKHRIRPDIYQAPAHLAHIDAMLSRCQGELALARAALAQLRVGAKGINTTKPNNNRRMRNGKSRH